MKIETINNTTIYSGTQNTHNRVNPNNKQGKDYIFNSTNYWNNINHPKYKHADLNKV